MVEKGTILRLLKPIANLLLISKAVNWGLGQAVSYVWLGKGKRKGNRAMAVVSIFIFHKWLVVDKHTASTRGTPAHVSGPGLHWGAGGWAGSAAILWRARPRDGCRGQAPWWWWNRPLWCWGSPPVLLGQGHGVFPMPAPGLWEPVYMALVQVEWESCPWCVKQEAGAAGVTHLVLTPNRDCSPGGMVGGFCFSRPLSILKSQPQPLF